MIHGFARKVFGSVEDVVLVAYWEDENEVRVRIVFPDFVEKVGLRQTLYDLQLELIQEGRGLLFDFRLILSEERIPENAAMILR